MTPIIKKILLGSLAAFGALIALVFIFGSLDPIKYDIAKSPIIPRFETIPKKSAVLSQTNITEEVAQRIAQEIIEKNPEGPNTDEQTGLVTVDPEVLVQDVIAQAFEEVKIEDLRPNITLADLVIIKSSEKALAEQYFSNLNKIIGSNFTAGISVNWENPAQTNFAALINAYAISMSESMAVAVPEDLAQLHREYVTLLGAEKNTLTLIKNYEIDPAQATVAIEAGDIFTRELAEVISRMNAYISKHKLILTA